MTQLDTLLFLWINATDATPGWHIELARRISTLLPAVAVLAPAPWVILGRLPRRQWLGACLAAGLAWLAVRGIRGMVHVGRPFELGLGHQWLAHATTSGFPSAHSAAAAAWAGGMTLLAPAHRGVWLLPTAAVALAIAWSRVFLGLHFVSDVALGLFLGATCAVVTVRLLGGLSPKAVLATSIKREPGAGNH
jgi:undecaprenyl-diphosphatase